VPEIVAEHFVPFARRTVLISDDTDEQSTKVARERLQAAGFADVTVLATSARASEIGAPGPRVAA